MQQYVHYSQPIHSSLSMTMWDGVLIKRTRLVRRSHQDSRYKSTCTYLSIHALVHHCYLTLQHMRMHSQTSSLMCDDNCQKVGTDAFDCVWFAFIMSLTCAIRFECWVPRTQHSDLQNSENGGPLAKSLTSNNSYSNSYLKISSSSTFITFNSVICIQVVSTFLSGFTAH